MSLWRFESVSCGTEHSDETSPIPHIAKHRERGHQPSDKKKNNGSYQEVVLINYSRTPSPNLLDACIAQVGKLVRFFLTECTGRLYSFLEIPPLLWIDGSRYIARWTEVYILESVPCAHFSGPFFSIAKDFSKLHCAHLALTVDSIRRGKKS